MTPIDLNHQTCSNRRCSFKDKPDIAIHDRKRHRFRCRHCGKTWVGHRGTFQYGLRTKEIRVRRALQLLKANLPIRKIAQFVRVSPSTVMRWKKRTK